MTREPREIAVTGLDAELTHAEWLPDSKTVVAIGKEAPGRHVLISVSVDGGTPRVVHRFASEHDFPGVASAPDGREIAFVRLDEERCAVMLAPAAGGDGLDGVVGPHRGEDRDRAEPGARPPRRRGATAVGVPIDPRRRCPPVSRTRPVDRRRSRSRPGPGRRRRRRPGAGARARCRSARGGCSSSSMSSEAASAREASTLPREDHASKSLPAR